MNTNENRKITNQNRVMLADSYKYSHATQYPNMISMYDYMESRGGTYPSTVFVGLQYYIKYYFSTPITQWEVDEAYEKSKNHGIPFDIDGWNYIVQELNGKIPVRIKAINEGKLVPTHMVLMTIESTDKNVPWIAGWLETILMKVWYPTTVATKSYYVKQMLQKYGSSEWAQFAFQNFGDRGSSSVESAAIGGFAHLTQFMGTDNFNSLDFCEDFYNVPQNEIAGFSVFASEHSTVCANADGSTENEIFFVERMLQENPDAPIMSFVADSYDVYNFTDKVTQDGAWIRRTIENRPNQKFVIRPDSGKPLDVLPKMFNIMKNNNIFDIEIKGQDGIMRMASSNYGILWGDGITPETIEEILIWVTENGYAAENMVFGSGGDIMQNINRDTQRFAVKCSSITRPNGTEQDVFKDPITDPGKKSKKGRISTFINKDNGEYFVGRIGTDAQDALNTVFENGIIYNQCTLQDIRNNS